MTADAITLVNSISPRSAGMGGATVSNAKDSEAISVNPAGLANSEILFGFSAPFGEGDMGFSISDIGYASKYFGFKISYLNIDKITTTDDSGATTGNIAVGNYASTLALAYTFMDNYSFGLAANLIYEQAGYYDELAYSFDVGTQVKIIDGMAFGLVYKNIGESARPEPSYINAGLSYDIGRILFLSSELDHSLTDSKCMGKFGAELNLFEALSLRAGYDTRQNTSFGFGIKLDENRGKINIAYMINKSLPNSFTVSYTLPLGGK